MKPPMKENFTPIDPQSSMGRPRFRVVGQASVKHINVRKQGVENDRILAVDMKLSFTGVDQSICSFFNPLLEDFLWRPHLEGFLTVADPFLEPLRYTHHLTGCMMQVGRENFHQVQARHFTLAPEEYGKVQLGCGVSLYPKDQKQVDHVVRMMGELAMISLFGPLDLFSQ